MDSILKQTFPKWELLVVSNGSEDSSENIAQAYADLNPRVRVIKTSRNTIAFAKNLGLDNCYSNSEFVCFLSPEDHLEPTALEKMYDLLMGASNSVGCHAVAKYVDLSDRPTTVANSNITDRLRLGLVGTKVSPIPPHRPTTFECFVVRNYIPVSGAALLRKSAVLSAGGCDPVLAPCEEWDLYTRLSRRGTFRFMDEVIVNHRVGGNKPQVDPQRIRESEIKLRKKIATSPDNTPDQSAAAETVFKLLQRYYIKKKLQTAKKAVSSGQLVTAVQNLSNTVKPIVSLIKGKP